MFYPRDPTAQMVAAVLIHLVVPALGVAAFGALCLLMKRRNVPQAPYGDFFLLFFSWGGWLITVLTLLFWLPSGMMYLGGLYLMFIAPVVMLAIQHRLTPQRGLSGFHAAAHQASTAYLAWTVFVYAAWVMLIMAARWRQPQRPRPPFSSSHFWSTLSPRERHLPGSARVLPRLAVTRYHRWYEHSSRHRPPAARPGVRGAQTSRPAP